MFNSEWYNSLNKPFLSPPNEVFTPVWVILYILIFISLLIYLKGGIKNKLRGLIFFTTQMILNFCWTFIFFKMQNIGFALIEIGIMWLFISLTIYDFIKHSKIAAILLIPYLLWVSFAFYLNFSYFVLN